jgi:broad specificity phosphatase PhoE
MLPIDLIFVRHGQSEGNVANKASRRADNHFFTPEFRARHSREFRLTDKGILQAKSAGEWLRANVPQPLDRFYVSDYIRAKETAALLELPQASWR